MESIAIGKKIKSLRQSLGWSQRDLAEGICTQALISHIEQNKTSPTIDIFFNLINKLGAPVDYFLESHDNSLDYINEVHFQIRKNIQENNFLDVKDMIRAERNNPIFKSRKYQQFILWSDATCDYFLNKDYDIAIAKIEKAIALTNTRGSDYSEREIEILITLANILDSTERFEDSARIFKKINQSFKLLKHIEDRKIQIRFLFNYSLNEKKFNRIKESLALCEKGIKLCKQHGYLYGFGEFHFQKGRCLIELKELEQAIPLFKKAKQIFDLQGNKDFSERSLIEIKECEEALNVR